MIGPEEKKHLPSFNIKPCVMLPSIFISFSCRALIHLYLFLFTSSFQGIPEDDFIMGESLDIIEKVDSDERFGTTGQILPATGRKDIKAWQKSVQTLLRTLQRPRYVATGLLPEFQQLDGRHAFIKNHQLPPYEKPEWKGDGTDENPGMPMDEKLKLYAEAIERSYRFFSYGDAMWIDAAAVQPQARPPAR